MIFTETMNKGSNMYNKTNTMNKEFLKLQKIAGLITESEYKEKVTKNEKLPRIGTKVLDHMGDEYQIIKVEPKTITLEPLTFEGTNSIFPQDFKKNATVEKFWSYFKEKK